MTPTITQPKVKFTHVHVYFKDGHDMEFDCSEVLLTGYLHVDDKFLIEAIVDEFKERLFSRGETLLVADIDRVEVSLKEITITTTLLRTVVNS